MSYSKEPIRVLAGGLVLSLPGDIINSDDSTELINFSTDSLGALRSRRGHTVLCSVSGVENQIRGVGGRYQNAAGTVYKQCAGIMAGVDGPTLVSWRGFVWSPPRKTDGASDFRWIPEAPTSAPTIKPAAEVVTPIDDFTGGWTVDPGGSDVYDGTLRIQPGGESVFSAEKEFSTDLYTGFDKDDIFRIRLKAKHWDVVTGVTFEVDVNEGDFKKDYYSAVMGLKNINAAKKEEITFYIRKRPLPVDEAAKDKNRYGAFTRIGSTPEKDWRSVTKLRVKVAFSDGTKFWFENWEMVGDTDNTLEGDDFQVAYTYVSAEGHESNPSPLSEPITVNRSGIDVSGLTLSSDPQVTGMRIYLTGGTLQGVYSVTGPPIPQATTYNIRAKDDDLTGFNIQLEDDHQDPPSGVTWGIGPYFDRIILFKGNRYYWSHQNKPYAFAHPDDETGGDWGAIEEGLGDILHVTMRPGQLWMHCQNGVAMMEGDPGGPASSVHRASSQMGISSSAGVVQAPEGDYCNFADGIFLFNGGSAQEVSRKIQTVFKGKGNWNADNAAMGYRAGIVWASDGSRTFRLDTMQDRWFEDSRVFTSFYFDNGQLLGATVGGELVALESGVTDGGATIPLIWCSKDFDCGLQDDEKRFGDFSFWANTGGASLLVQAILTSPNQTITLGTISSSGEERFVLPFAADGEGVDARRCAIRVTGSTDAEVVLHSMELWFYPKARQGKSFDTGEVDLGTFKMKRILQVDLDADNQASALVTVKSDRPQPMADRTVLSLDATTDRRIQPLVIDDNEEIIGRLFRIVPHGDDLRVYGGRVLHQVYGTYIEGDEGEYYRSGGQNFGTERVKLVHEAELIYSGAAGTFTLYTDLPGNALAVRGVADFPATTGLQSIKIRCNGTIKGRLVDIGVESVGGCRIQEIRLWIKMVGAPNATPWQEVSMPLVGTQEAVWAEVGFGPDAPG